MPQSSPPKKLITNNSPFPKSPTLVSNQPTKWLNAIHDTVNTCHAACCTEVMLCQKMLTLQLLQLRPKGQFSLLTGAQPVSKSESTTNHQLLFQAEIWPKFNELFAC